MAELLDQNSQVLFARNDLTKKVAEVVEVLRRMPSDVDGEPQYRIKASDEGFERSAKEHPLSTVRSGDIVSACPIVRSPPEMRC
jgi:hypothetical protein